MERENTLIIQATGKIKSLGFDVYLPKDDLEKNKKLTYEHYHHILTKKIIEKHIKLAQQNKITENFGEKDYREYREKVNSEDNLSVAQKANLCSFLSDELNNIDINS
jgi:hypothetical protein